MSLGALGKIKYIVTETDEINIYYFNVTITKFQVTYVACIILLLCLADLDCTFKDHRTSV